jgi:hypothetical protein
MTEASGTTHCHHSGLLLRVAIFNIAGRNYKKPVEQHCHYFAPYLWAAILKIATRNFCSVSEFWTATGPKLDEPFDRLIKEQYQGFSFAPQC